MLTIAEHHQFVLQVSFGLFAGFLVIIWTGIQSNANLRKWADVTLASLITGLIGARLLYVMLNWSEFADYPDDIVRQFWVGDLVWQGALLGLGGGWLMARLRGIKFARWADGAALAIPLLMMAVWGACRSRGWGYGLDLESPSWITGYLPNEDGDIARRLELQILGIWSGLILLGSVTWLTLQQKLEGQRLWLVLSLLGISQLLLGLGRGDEWTVWLDGLVFGSGLLGLGVTLWFRWRINQRMV